MRINIKLKVDDFTLNIKDLIIEEGIYGIVGKNGSGKTTILKAVSKEINSNLKIEGFNGKIIYVSQNPYMFKGTVFENIAMPLIFSKSDNIDKKVFDALNKLEINDLKNKYAKNLSSGERLKVALARAIICKPDLLLIDEITANVDILSKKWIYQTLENLKSNMTIIFATHDILDIKNCVDKMIYLENGEIKYQGECDYDIDFMKAYKEMGSDNYV